MTEDKVTPKKELNHQKASLRNYEFILRNREDLIRQMGIKKYKRTLAMVRRYAGAKDETRMLPEHGGVLDEDWDDDTVVR